MTKPTKPAQMRHTREFGLKAFAAGVAVSERCGGGEAMNRSVSVFVQHGPAKKVPRDYARDITKQGIALLGHAFNACDNEDLPYRYSKAAVDEMKECLSKVWALMEEGAIVELPHVMAKKDARYQRFMESATAPKA